MMFRFTPFLVGMFAFLFAGRSVAQLPVTKVPIGAPAGSLPAWALIARGNADNFAFVEMKIVIAFSITTESGEVIQNGTYDSDDGNSSVQKELLPVIESMRRPLTAPFYPVDNFGPIREIQIDGKTADCFAYDRNMAGFNRNGSARIDKGDVCFERDRGVVLRHTLNGKTWTYSDHSKEFNGKILPHTVTVDAPPYRGSGTLRYSKPAPKLPEPPSPYKDWSLTSLDGIIKFVANGATIHGHEFGFIKKSDRCGEDLLWILWSTREDGLEEFVGTQTTMQFRVGTNMLQIEAPLVAVNNFTPNTKVVTFSNFTASETLISQLKAGRNIQVTLRGPVELTQKFDVKADTFSLLGFTAARQKALELCAALPNR